MFFQLFTSFFVPVEILARESKQSKRIELKNVNRYNKKYIIYFNNLDNTNAFTLL